MLERGPVLTGLLDRSALASGRVLGREAFRTSKFEGIFLSPDGVFVSLTLNRRLFESLVLAPPGFLGRLTGDQRGFERLLLLLDRSLFQSLCAGVEFSPRDLEGLLVVASFVVRDLLAPCRLHDSVFELRRTLLEVGKEGLLLGEQLPHLRELALRGLQRFALHPYGRPLVLVCLVALLFGVSGTFKGFAQTLVERALSRRDLGLGLFAERLFARTHLRNSLVAKALLPGTHLCARLLPHGMESLFMLVGGP